MDFVFGLPETRDENDSILVIVDRFSKMDHYIPCYKTSDARHVPNLFSMRLLGYMLYNIDSNIDTRFTSHFWRTLWKKRGTKFNFNSIYHPKTDGKIEVVNKSHRNILRSLVGKHPKKWDHVQIPTNLKIFTNETFKTNVYLAKLIKQVIH